MISRATEADLPALMVIEQRSFLQDQFSEALYLSFLLRPDADVFLYRKEQQVVGSLVLIYSIEEEICHVISVAVHPDCQGHGYGREMMQFAERKALEKKCSLIQLEVRVNNVRARELYKAMGFEESKTLRGFYGDGVDGIRYVKKL